jgi:hypothetical protein
VKTFLKVFGLASLLILGAFAILFVNAKLYDSQISAYANDAILAIATDWNEQALRQRASPELFAASTQQDINAAFQNYRQLGRMTKYNVARSRAHVDVGFTLVHKRVTAVYLATADFEHGSAEIKLSLLKRNGRWYITGLHVTAYRLDRSASLLPKDHPGGFGRRDSGTCCNLHAEGRQTSSQRRNFRQAARELLERALPFLSTSASSSCTFPIIRSNKNCRHFNFNDSLGISIHLCSAYRFGATVDPRLTRRLVSALDRSRCLPTIDTGSEERRV